MRHASYARQCSELVRKLLLREGSLRKALAEAAGQCLPKFHARDVPYGDRDRCEEVIRLLTADGTRTPAEVVAGMDDARVRQVVGQVFELLVTLLQDETMLSVDHQWRTTYLRPLRFHN